MRKSSLHLIKYVIGFSLALIAVSNCFNVQSSSSSLTAPRFDSGSPIAAAKTVSQHSSLVSQAGANHLFASRPADTTSAVDLATHASLVSTVASPFAPAITATKSHMPAGSANPGDTLTYTVVISNSGTDATGVNFTDTIDPNTTLIGSSVIASPIALDDSYHTIGNVNISVPAGQGVIANDLNPNGAGTLTVTKVNSTPVPGGGSATTSTANGSVTMSSDGSFSYNPNVAFRGPSDTFTYTLDNGTGKTDTATVTIAVNGLIWFVNVAAAPGGDGRLSSPFNCLVGPGCFEPVAADIANDNIFVYTGAYVGGLALLNGQKLIGQGAGDTLLNITGLTAPSGTNMLPATGGTPPAIAAAGSNITLGSGNTVRGVTLNGTAPAAGDLTGTGFGTLTIAETTLGGVGQALNLNNGTLTGPVASTAAFVSISSVNSSTTGVSLTNVVGNMSSGSTSITNSTGIGVYVDTSSAALNFGPTSSVLSGGAGVSLTTNTGTITFGTLDISPNPGQRGFVATENTMTLTSSGGTISTSGATAVQISRSSGTTPLAIALTSVSASASPPNGIFLSGTSGSFTVNGDGTNISVGGNSTGGTITGATGADSSTNGIAVYLNNVTNVTLRRMTINGANQNFGIYGTSANTFNLEYSTVSGTNGTNDLLNEGSIAFDGLVGSASLKNDNISGAWKDTVRVTNTSGTLNRLTVDNVTFGANNASFGNSALITSVAGTGVLNLTVQSSSFTSSRSTQLQYTMNAGTPSGDVLIDNNTFTDAQAQISGAAGIFLTSGGIGSNPTLTYHISNNTISGMSGAGIALGKGIGTGNFNGTITANQVGTSGVSHSGGTNGISLVHLGGGTNTMAVTNNTILQFDTDGILLQDGSNTSGGNGTIDATVTGNSVKEAFGAFPNAAFELNNGTTSADAHFVCLGLGGAGALKNDFAKSPSASAYNVNEIRLRMRFNSTTRLPGYAGAVNDTAAVATFVAGNNTLTSGAASVTVSTSSPNGYVGGAACTPATASIGDITIASVDRGVASRDLAGESEGILRAAPGGALTKDDSVQRLRQRELSWIVQAAIERWRQAAISGEDLERLRAATFEVTDLPEGQIASATGSHITVDGTAAGYGWFFDQTPSEDSEFEVVVPGKELQSTELSPAHGKMDLLTVVVRELGRIYLAGTDRIPRNLRPLMEATLSPAVRRMPAFNIPDRSSSSLSPGSGHSLDAKAIATVPSRPASDSSASPIPAVFNPSADLMPGSYGRSARRMSYAANARRVAAVSPFSGETITLNISTIPAGESVTIMFQVTINNPLPNGVCSVTNQGHVTGSNFSPVDTNSDVTPINKAVTISACPANVTTNADAGLCTAVVTYTTPTGDGCPAPTVTCTPASGSAFGKGTTTVTCTASNGNPPDATCTFTVTVSDNQPPTITCPANVTHGTDAGVCSAVVTYANATATDNCTGVGTPVCTPASGSTFNKGTTTVSCTVSDASSNSAGCSFTVTVNDTTAPSITCPANVTQSTDPNQCTAVVTYANATATDNCPGVGAPVCTPASGSTFVLGVTTVTCTVSDASSNSANCSFTVTVKDTQAPSLSPCPANISVTSGGGCQVVNYTPPTATDNCGSATVVCSPPSGFCFAPGTTTVTCTASDSSPDSPDTSCSFMVTVIPCAITCPSNISVNNTPNQCGAVVTYAPTFGGGCGTVTCTPSSGSFFPVGSTTVSCITQAGPACSFTVTVVDAQAPTITTCPANRTLSTNGGNQIALPSLTGEVVATDNCTPSGSLVITQSPVAGTMIGLGNTLVTITVKDAANNQSTCTVTITVVKFAAKDFVVFSSESTKLSANATVHTGNVGANNSLPDPNGPPDDKEEVEIGERVTMLQTGSSVVGDTVRLRANSQVYNVYFNESFFSPSATILGSQVTPQSLPVTTMPAFPTVTPGTTDVVVPANSTVTLAPGSYRNVTVNNKGTLKLTGGLYQISTFDIRQEANIFCLAQSEIRVKIEMDTDAKAFIGPDPSAPALQASQIVFYVEGADGGGGLSPTAVQIGERNTVFANIYAANGTVVLKANTIATGAFIGKQAQIGERVELTLKSAF